MTSWRLRIIRFSNTQPFSQRCYLYWSLTYLILEDLLLSILPPRDPRRAAPSWPHGWMGECAEAVRRRDATKKYRSNPTLSTQKELSSYKHVLKKAKREGWRTFCGQLGPFTLSSAVWKMIKRFRNRRLGVSTDIAESFKSFVNHWHSTIKKIYPPSCSPPPLLFHLPLPNKIL